MHDIVYFKRHRDDDASQSIPGRDFVQETCPISVRHKINVVLVAVAAAPPHRFAGGGYWEAMHGIMAGWYEVRIDGPKRHHYRLFCLLDYDALNSDAPLLTVICGLDKPFRTQLSGADYDRVLTLGAEYLSRNPRSIA
ncbi:MAG: hypothetical protein WCP28_10715 [Actinomycetes bacterium]